MENSENTASKSIFKLIDQKNNGFITVQDIKDMLKKVNFEVDLLNDENSIEILVNTISKSSPQNTDIPQSNHHSKN